MTLNAHRLMVRPRESPTLQPRATRVTIVPEATTTWTQDVFGNHIVTARFDGETSRLSIEATSELTLSSPQWPIFTVDPDATRFPFVWVSEDA